jgi:hypothetical protein
MQQAYMRFFGSDVRFSFKWWSVLVRILVFLKKLVVYFLGCSVVVVRLWLSQPQSHNNHATQA